MESRSCCPAVGTKNRTVPPAGHRRREAEVLHRYGEILVVEDDPELRDAWRCLSGTKVIVRRWRRTAPRPLIGRGKTVQPDLILADYNLPNGMDGLQVIAKLREKLHREIPVIILTGDISTDTLRDIARHDCVQLNKPVKLKVLAQAVQRLLPVAQPAAHAHAPHPAKAASSPEPPLIFVIDDDNHVREAIRAVLEEAGRTVEDYPTCEAFLEAYRPGRGACLLIDAYLPGMNGLELLQRLMMRAIGCRPS